MLLACGIGCSSELSERLLLQRIYTFDSTLYFFLCSYWALFCSLLLDCWLATIRSDDRNKCLCWKAVKVSLFLYTLGASKKWICRPFGPEDEMSAHTHTHAYTHPNTCRYVEDTNYQAGDDPLVKSFHQQTKDSG